MSCHRIAVVLWMIRLVALSIEWDPSFSLTPIRWRKLLAGALESPLFAVRMTALGKELSDPAFSKRRWPMARHARVR
jgi:hypothetical protein